MNFIKKIRSKTKYDELINACFLRAASKDNMKNYEDAVCKVIGNLLIVLCFNNNGNTVSVRKDMFDDMLEAINSNEYRYSADRIFDVASLNTVSLITLELMKINPNDMDWRFREK